VPTPENFGINIDKIIDVLAEADGITNETPHKVLAAFDELPIAEKPDLPKWDEITPDNSNISPFSPPGTLRSMDDPESQFRQLQDNIALREAAGEIGGDMPDLVGPIDQEARIRSSELEGEKTA
jgi:hypothetical protein